MFNAMPGMQIAGLSLQKYLPELRIDSTFTTSIVVLIEFLLRLGVSVEVKESIKLGQDVH